MPYKIGIFSSDFNKYYEQAQDIISKYINDRGYKILRTSKTSDRLTVICEEVEITYIYANNGSRGHRWNKVYILGEIDKEIFDNVIYTKIIPYCKDWKTRHIEESWLNDEHIEYIK